MRVEFKNRYVENEARLLAALAYGPLPRSELRARLLDTSEGEMSRLRRFVLVDGAGRWYIDRQVLIGIGRLTHNLLALQKDNHQLSTTECY